MSALATTTPHALGPILFQVGPLTISRRPYHIEEWRRTVTASWPRKDLLGRRPEREFTGEGEEALVLRGTLHPFNLSAFNGLSSLEMAKSLCRKGLPSIVTRGDGHVLGYYAITDVDEYHTALGPQTGGVGQIVGHELTLVPVGEPTQEQAFDMFTAMIGLVR